MTTLSVEYFHHQSFKLTVGVQSLFEVTASLLPSKVADQWSHFQQLCVECCIRTLQYQLTWGWVRFILAKMR